VKGEERVSVAPDVDEFDGRILPASFTNRLLPSNRLSRWLVAEDSATASLALQP
jgi:hypothetical protein